jgi:hypothetical protein
MIARSRDKGQSNRVRPSFVRSVSRPPEIGFVLRNWLPRRHRPPPPLRTAPAGAGNWLRFANDPRNRPVGGSVKASGLGDGLPCPRSKLASFCTIASRPRGPIPPGPAGNWLRFAQSAPGRRSGRPRIGFVSHVSLPGEAVPHTMTAFAHMPQSSQVWLCFARLALGRLGIPARHSPKLGLFRTFRPRSQRDSPKLASFCTIGMDWNGGMIE